MTMEFINHNTETDELEIKIGKESWQDIVINKELVLHVYRSADEGYVVDVYRNSKLSDEHSYEEDHITTMYAEYQDLHRQIIVNMEVEDSEVESEDFYLVGSKLLWSGEQIGEDLDEEQITQAILDRVSNKVLYIEIDGEKIYEIA